MKIQEKSSLDLLDVFAVYWDQTGKTFFLAMGPGDELPHAYLADEVDLVEKSFPFRLVYLSNHMKGICHWALIERGLLDELIDGNPVVREEFLQILRLEKAIDW